MLVLCWLGELGFVLLSLFFYFKFGLDLGYRIICLHMSVCTLLRMLPSSIAIVLVFTLWCSTHSTSRRGNLLRRSPCKSSLSFLPWCFG
jgi:hypothetical protein